MLQPNDRRQLLTALHPPAGYDLDAALGTSFTLDLLSLLTLPVAFTLREWHSDGAQARPDPLALLEALRRYADKLTIFCQAGRIAVPPNAERLYGYLEQSVVEVRAPHAPGVFHPKVWVLRFTAKDKSQPVRYRFLCATRNLTADRSWDTLLTLDGELTDREKGISANHPLADFIAALPALALRPLPADRLKLINRIQDELRRVRFELPDGIEDYRFWPLGIENHRRWPLSGRIDRLLVMAPFVDPLFLQRFAEIGQRHVLISRLESLSALPPAALRHFKDVYALSTDAQPDEAIDETAEEAPQLQGLHAKLFLIEDGWNARLFTGSANATQAAFERNVEFLVELIGKRSALGIDALLQSGNKKDVIGFADLLQKFKPGEVQAPDAAQQAADALLNQVRTQLVAAQLRAVVSAIPNDTRYQISLHLPEQNTWPVWPNDISVHCWPITLPPASASPLGPAALGGSAFSPVSFEALTAFFAFEVIWDTEPKPFTTRFVLNLPLEGAPEDRAERLLRLLLGNRQQVLRFLYYLLADDQVDVSEVVEALPGDAGTRQSGDGGWILPADLFETMVRALHRQPDRLVQVQRLVDDLRRSPASQELLPADFDIIWEPIWQAYRELYP